MVEAELNKNSISFVYFMKNGQNLKFDPFTGTVFLFNITQRAKSPRVLNLNGGLMRNSYQVS